MRLNKSDEAVLFGRSLYGKCVRFAHQTPADCHTVTNVTLDGMIEITGLDGQFAHSLFMEVACPIKCGVCAEADHHWLFQATDERPEGYMECKHCDAAREVTEDDE